LGWSFRRANYRKIRTPTLPKNLRNDFRAWLDEQVGYWQY